MLQSAQQTAATAKAQAAAAAAGDPLLGRTLGTEEVAVAATREAAAAGIRLRERQILQRMQFVAGSQLAEVRRAGGFGNSCGGRRK